MRLFHHFLYACKYIIFAVMTQEKLPHRKELCLQSDRSGFAGPVFLYYVDRVICKSGARDLRGCSVTNITNIKNINSLFHIVRKSDNILRYEKIAAGHTNV